MDLQSHIKKLLIKAGLNDSEASFYLFVLENKGCSISDVYKKSDISKSSAYRAFDSLKNLELLKSDSTSWKTNLDPLSLSGLIKKLENTQRTQRRLILELKTINKAESLTGNSRIAGIETLNGDEIWEKYLDLSEMKYGTNLSYGSWEDFNREKSLLPIERKFIKNRLKNGNSAKSCLTRTGPNTKEITDHDLDQNRITSHHYEDYLKPIWINAFENNNFVYIWEIDEKGKSYGTLIDSKPVADFYKTFIHKQTLQKN